MDKEMTRWAIRRVNDIKARVENTDDAVIELAGAVLKEFGMNSEMGGMAMRAINASLVTRMDVDRTVDDLDVFKDMEG